MNSSKQRFGQVSGIVFAALIYLFLYLPILVVIVFSFNASRMNIEFTGFTLAWYGIMFQNASLMSAFQNTVIVAVASTAFSTLIGTIAAIGMYRYTFKGKGTVDSLLYIPIVIPEIVMGISLLAFFSLLHITTGLLTLIIAHVTFSMPFVLITVRSRMAGYDQAVEEAAMDLGATRLRTLRRVTLPIIAPGIMAGAMLALTLSLDDVIVSFFTCGINSVTLPIKIFSLVRTGVTPDVNALATVIVLATILVMILWHLFEKRSAKQEQAV